MRLDVVGSRPFKRPHQLAIVRRQAHTTCMRAAGRTQLLFYSTKFATKLTPVSHVRI
jgi:hypothetical protein